MTSIVQTIYTGLSSVADGVAWTIDLSTFPADVTPGNQLVVFGDFAGVPGTDVGDPTGGAGGAWDRVDQSTPGTPQGVALWVRDVAAGDVDATLSVLNSTGSSRAGSLAAVEVSGFDPSWSTPVTNAGSGVSAGLSALTVPDGGYVAAVVRQAGSTTTPRTTTGVDSINNHTQAMRGHKIVSPAGDLTAGLSWTTTRLFDAVAAFLSPAGAPSGSIEALGFRQ